jgi:hypothetical protein
MKNHENSMSISKTSSLRETAALLADRRLCPFRYAVGLVALFIPLAQGCGDSSTCAMTATCRPSDKGDARSTANVTPDGMWDAGADDSDSEADPDLSEGGSSTRDSARDERSTSDGTGGGLNDGATRSDGGAETDAGGNNDGTPRADAGTADGSDSVPTTDAAEITDATLPDVFADAPLDTPPDVPVCDASPDRSPLDEPCLVDEAYGAFVSPRGSDITGNGSRAAPYRTIGRAMRASKRGRRVFVCDDGTGYSDPIVVDSSTDGHAVYGAFDCATWVPSATARARVLPKAGPAIIVNGLAVGITLENFELRAADAAVGASSIAAKIDTHRWASCFDELASRPARAAPDPTVPTAQAGGMVRLPAPIKMVVHPSAPTPRSQVGLPSSVRAARRAVVAAWAPSVPSDRAAILARTGNP